MTEFISVRGGKLAVKVYEPKVHKADAILIHGYTGSKEDFSLMGPLLAELGYRVVTSDNRGQFESDHSSDYEMYKIASLVEDQVALSRHFGLDRPHLLGHSFGGLVAQRAAADFSKAWASLTLLCSGPHGMEAWSLLNGDIEFLAENSMADLWVANGESQKPGNEPGSLKQRRWFASDKHSLITHARHLMSERSVINELKASGLPVNVVRGEHDDAWPHDMQAQMAADLGSRIEIIGGAGHCPNEDKPLETTAALVKFWTALD